ncbi:hypothetical protein ACIGW4_33065 [Streptomyces sp. NPDC053513]|uniref:hypothetical protein n=1 Tax=unclassified Streptomyces TaxID=2593676 RepID=UPI0037D0E27E
MNIKTARRIAAATLVGAALISAAPASAADWFSSLDGVTAFSLGTHGQIAVSDTAVDGNPVYANYYRRNGSGVQRLWNYSGAGKTVFSNFDESHPVTWIEGCIHHNVGYPDCGPIRSE